MHAKRVSALIAATCVIYLGIITQFIAANWVFPNTTLGTSDISFRSRRDIDTKLGKLNRLTYQIQVKDRVYTYTYDELGVVIDHDAILAKAFEPNLQPFPVNTILLLKSLFVKREVPISVVFTTDFADFLERTVFDFGSIPDYIAYDRDGKNLEYVDNEEKYSIEENFFANLLRERIGDNQKPLYPKLVRMVNNRARAAADTNERIKKVILSPLTVFIEADGIKESFILTEKDLTRLMHLDLTPEQTSVVIGIDEINFTEIFNEYAKKLSFLVRGNVATLAMKEELQRVLTMRYDGHTADAMTIGLDSGPNTTGSKAKKYIEIDISQQKMYIFRDGKLINTYRVSTGREYPTPTGEFSILNKAGVGYSKIYNVYMPFWMGFYLDPKLHAYFGIHELPYFYSGGNKIQRPREFIGSPNTGGCVALDIGAAKEVYQFADIGTKVVIFN